MCVLNPFNFGPGLFQKFGGKFVITNRPGKIDTTGVLPKPPAPPAPLPPKPVPPPVVRGTRDAF
jgi:hypothetical protein